MRSGVSLLVCGALLACSGGTRAAQAQESPAVLPVATAQPASPAKPANPSTAGQKDVEETSDRPLAVGASLIPGALVHGAGHFVRGEKKTARTLLLMEGTGLGFVAVGLGGLALTGASRRVVTPLAMTTIVGGSLFLLSWVADVYGSARGAEPLGRPGFVPSLETSLGVRGIYDPIFSHRFLVVESIDARFGKLRLSPSMTLAPGRPSTRARVEVGYRFLGEAPEHVGDRSRPSRGSYLEAYGGVTHHAYTVDAFQLTTFEWMLQGRVDLRLLGRLLRGSFAELGLGTGVVRNHYDALGVNETTTLLLGKTAFGTYVGDGRGEVALVYDHRRDGFVGGARLPGIPAGFLGSGGMRAKYFFTEELGLSAEMLFGGAYLGGLSVVVRQ